MFAISAVWLLLGAIFGVVFVQLLQANQKALTRWTSAGLAIAALVYVAFAWWNHVSDFWILVEVAGLVFFSAFALAGWQGNLKALALGWLLHGMWDWLVHIIGPGTHVPPLWYAWICAGFDLAVAGMLFHLATTRTVNT